MNPLSGFNIYTVNKETIPKNVDNHHIIIDLKYINPEIKQLLSQLEITVTHIELFYRTSKNFGLIHTDNAGGDFTKINWVFGGRTSTMSWFELKDSVCPDDKPIIKTVAETDYKLFECHEVDFKYQIELKQPALVQVGKPHLVINLLEDRYAVCFVLADKNGNRIPMRKAQEYLKDYII